MAVPLPLIVAQTWFVPVDVAVNVTTADSVVSPYVNVTLDGENVPSAEVGVIVTVCPAYCGGRLTEIVSDDVDPMYSGVGASVIDTVSRARTSTLSVLGALK